MGGGGGGKSIDHGRGSNGKERVVMASLPVPREVWPWRRETHQVLDNVVAS